MLQKLFAAGLVGIILPGVVLAQNIKIGVVNSDVIVGSFPKFKEAEAQLMREVEGWRKGRTNWEAEMKSLQDDIRQREEQLGGPLSEKGKVKLRGQIDSLTLVYNEQLQRKMMEEQEHFNQRRAELMAEVLEGVNETIEEMGDQSGFDIIIDSGNGIVVYARDPEDLTDELLQRLKNK